MHTFIVFLRVNKQPIVLLEYFYQSEFYSMKSSLFLKALTRIKYIQNNLLFFSDTVINKGQPFFPFTSMALIPYAVIEIFASCPNLKHIFRPSNIIAEGRLSKDLLILKMKSVELVHKSKAVWSHVMALK